VTEGRTAAAVTFLLVMAAGAGSCARPVDHTLVPERPAPLGTVGVAPGAPGVPWSRKSFEQRMEFMGLTFHPRMRELFREYDAAAYDKLRCQTCHGEDMEARRFAMPATLQPLPAEGAIEAANARDAKATAFMVAKVVPLSGELFAGGASGAREQLSCASCHPH